MQPWLISSQVSYKTMVKQSEEEWKSTTRVKEDTEEHGLISGAAGSSTEAKTRPGVKEKR